MASPVDAQMVIRPVTYGDIDALVEMGRRMHAEGAYAFLDYDAGKVGRMMKEVADHPETYCGLVAEDNGELIGMLGGYLTDYFFSDQKLACDMVLYVTPERRGGSAAARLIRVFRDWAVARGARELCLGISTGVNTEAIGRFYRGLGLTPVGGVYKQRLQEAGET